MPNGSGNPSAYQCFCGATFDTAAEVVQHSMTEHPDPPKEERNDDD